MFLDPDGDAEILAQRYLASISVIRSIRAGRSHDETTRWLVNPLTSRRRFDTEMVNAICASTDCALSRPPVWGDPSVPSIVGALVGSRRFSWMNCSAGTPPTE